MTVAFIACPRCGYSAASNKSTCPLCSAVLLPVNIRRLTLWSAVVVEYIMLILLLVSSRAL